MSRQNYENKRHRTSEPSGRRNPQNRRRRENSYRNSDRNSDWNSDWDSDWDSNWDSGEDYWLFSEDHPDLDDRRSRNSRSRSSRSFDERDTQPQRRRRPSQSNGQRHLDRQRDSGKKRKNKKRKKWKKILLIILLIFALLIAGIFFFILSKAKLLQYHAPVSYTHLHHYLLYSSFFLTFHKNLGIIFKSFFAYTLLMHL